MTRNQLLRIARIQQIDLFFTERGFSREFIHDRMVYPTFLISKRSYNTYLTINAKKILREKHGIDWEQELSKLQPVDFNKMMEWYKDVDLLQVPEYLLMLQEGAKR
ncbi:MAG TPA: hypothetical protein PLP27_05610 [Crocinitomicaceae bacterium]|nr:hypothetical protein [Crocinitomicaceae bacterium]